MSSLDSVLAQFRAAGMPEPDRLDVCGRIRRYGPKKRAWYVLREIRTRSGRTAITGVFGFWGRIDARRVEVDWRGLNDAERVAAAARMEAARAAEQAKRAQRAQIAALRAQQLWREAKPEGRSPYLVRKGVEPEAVRFLEDGTVVVPMVRYDLPRDQALVGAQTIRPDGTKRFSPGTAKRGAACRLGLVDLNAPILVCEGLATGLSIRMALARRLPVFVAFDAYNLLPVAEILRGLYPQAYLLFCADDDFLTPGNPGRVEAWKAARRVGHADVTYPVFRSRGARKLTDYNDLHAVEGLAAVAAHFERVLSFARDYGRYAA